MPYSSVSDVPSYVPKGKRKQWLAVFNSAWKRAKKDGKTDKEAEQSAFAQANAVAGPNSDKAAIDSLSNYDLLALPLRKSVGTTATGFVRAVDGPFKCAHCRFMKDGCCTEPEVLADPEIQDLLNDDGLLPVEPGDCCNEYEP